MLTASRTGWLAGIVDGEGCIYLAPLESRGFGTVTIVNTSQALLEEVGDILTAMGVKWNIYDHRRHGGLGKRLRRDIHVASKRHIWRLLTILRPHLVAKREAAEIVLEILRIGKRSAKARPLYERLRALNKR